MTVCSVEIRLILACYDRVAFRSSRVCACLGVWLLLRICRPQRAGRANVENCQVAKFGLDRMSMRVLAIDTSAERFYCSLVGAFLVV